MGRSVRKEGRDGSNGGDDYVGSVLGSQPWFAVWVERALEGFLRYAVEVEKRKVPAATVRDGRGEDGDNASLKGKDKDATPVFFDFHQIKSPSDAEAKDDRDTK